MARPFLTAAWTNLIVATYEVPANLLEPHLPAGCSLDTFQGQPLASLVGFQFTKTRVFGVGWPGYRSFPEWNLRFYVRRGDERGVVFIREFVPKRFVAWMARTFYNEPYLATPMLEQVTENAEQIAAEYQVKHGGRFHSLKALGRKPAQLLQPGTFEHFCLDQAWGYGRSRTGQLLRYEVSHPLWSIYPLVEFEAKVAWAELYGNEWGCLQNAKPACVAFAAGSAVSVL